MRVAREVCCSHGQSRCLPSDHSTSFPLATDPLPPPSLVLVPTKNLLSDVGWDIIADIGWQSWTHLFVSVCGGCVFIKMKSSYTTAQ